MEQRLCLLSLMIDRIEEVLERRNGRIIDDVYKRA
jgi:hypothetical protein